MNGLQLKFPSIFLKIFVLFLLIPLTLFCQEKSTVNGCIRDRISHQPISNVNIFFEKQRIGTSTNEKGYFEMTNAPVGKTVLVINHVGYHQREIKLVLKPGEIKKINMLLSPKTIPLTGVTFTANRSPESVFKSHQSVVVASEEKIELRTSPNTADALREIPGVLVQKTTAGHGSPIIRGMIGKDVLLLYNSIRLNKPTFRFGANQYMNTIDADILQQIEIVKGPGSVMYGSDAIGGLINMIPYSPQFGETSNSFQTMISLRYGSADQSRLGNIVFARQLGNFSVLTNFGMRKIGNLTAGKDIGEQSPTGYKEWNGNFMLHFQLNQQTRLEWDFLTVQQQHVPRYDKYVTGQYKKYEYHPQNRYLAAVTLHHNPAAKTWFNQVRWNFSYQFEKEGVIQQKSGSSSITQNNNKLTTWGSYLQLNSLIKSNHILSYGYEIYFDKVRSSRFKESNGSIEEKRPTFPDGSEYFSSGIFVNDQWIIRSDFEATIGFRWSYVALNSDLGAPFGKFKDRNRDFTTSIGFSYQLAHWLNFVGTYARGFRAPNFNDTVVLKVSNAGMDAPSPGLKPEKSHNFKLGFKAGGKFFSGSFFVFYNQLKDLIDRYHGTYLGLPFFDENGDGVRNADEAEIYQKRNAGRAYVSGWESSGDFRFSEKWDIYGFLFWTYGKNETLNEPMSRIPPLMGMISCRFLPTQNLQLEAFVRAAGKQARLSSRDKDDSRIPEGGTPGWKTFNLRARYFWAQNWSLHITFENIFDETYKEHGSGVYSPGRNLVLGVRFRK